MLSSLSSQITRLSAAVALTCLLASCSSPPITVVKAGAPSLSDSMLTHKPSGIQFPAHLGDYRRTSQGPGISNTPSLAVTYSRAGHMRSASPTSSTRSSLSSGVGVGVGMTPTHALESAADQATIRVKVSPAKSRTPESLRSASHQSLLQNHPDAISSTLSTGHGSADYDSYDKGDKWHTKTAMITQAIQRGDYVIVFQFEFPKPAQSPNTDVFDNIISKFEN